MRHNKKINHLGRKTAHRKAMLSNMAASLILHKRIVTTVAKAKALRVYIEPLITKSKDDTTHSRRTVFSYLQNKFAVAELFRDVAVKVAERPGGYTRILKTGNRLGDNAEMCIIELVDYNETLLKSKDEKKTKTRRRSKGKKGATEDTKKTTPVANEPVAEEPVAEEPVAEEPVAEEPVAEEPVAEEPVAEEPVAEEPVAEEPVAEEPVAEEPVAEEPVAEEPEEKKTGEDSEETEKK